MKFKEWFNSAPHRAKYTNDHPAYLAAQEAWEAAHEACAKVCDDIDTEYDGEDVLATWCAAAIRAKGETK